MGIVYRGIPITLALELRDKYGLKYFVETGTHIGTTAVWASREFERVITIEAEMNYYSIAKGQLDSRPHVTLHRGRSQDLLPQVLESLDAPALIWLDAHWSRDLVGGMPTIVCPVLDEIKAINEDGRGHVVLVDDARLFGNELNWPELSQVVRALDAGGRVVRVKSDVIVGELA